MSIWDQAPAPLGLCPHPEKIKFPDRLTALQKSLRMTGRDSRLRNIYLCACGWWHWYTIKPRSVIESDVVSHPRTEPTPADPSPGRIHD